MKISITYSPREEREARLIQRFAEGLLDDAKVCKSEAHPPIKHIYLTATKPVEDRFVCDHHGSD